jgi:hypothetical protein
MERKLQFRPNILRAHGASESETQELLAYNSNIFEGAGRRLDLVFPLPDEPFVKTWKDYAHEVAAAGTFSVLAKYLVQLQFPVKAGMSQDSGYLAATSRGAGFGREDSLRLELRAPESCYVALHPTPAGHIPLMIAEDREDFAALVRALARRNEPEPVPPSMGACMVSGYNNWGRVFSLLNTKGTMQPLEPALYQDRFIILSKGYYSGVQPEDLGMGAADWRELSFIIRREHESTHYFTRRVFSSMRNYLLDEILADYCGIVTAAGRFRADWMLRFFGLERFPEYRTGARLENYKGNPKLSAGAFVVLQKLVKHAADNLQAMNQLDTERQQFAYPVRALLTLSTFTLEELASSNAHDLLREALAPGKEQEITPLGLGPTQPESPTRALSQV